MAGYEEGPEVHGHGVASPISLPWVLASTVLCGIGLWLVAFWLISGFTDWPNFVGVPLVIVGAIMFLNPRMGHDHA